MRWLLTSMLVLMGLFGQAQDWAPYVPGQVSYYSTEGEYRFQNHHYIDSGISIRALYDIAYRQNHTTYFFKHNNIPDSLTFLRFCSSLVLPDSLTYENGVYTYRFWRFSTDEPDSNRFYFDHPVGTKWSITSPFECLIDFQIIDIRIDTFLGIIDSVKEISINSACQDSGTMIISKNHGFISGFLPIPGLRTQVGFEANPGYSTPFQHLVGIQTDTLSIGYHMPDYTDFIPYTPGTIMKWDLSEGGIDPPHHSAYLRDSVLKIEFDSAHTLIRVLREEYDITSGKDSTYEWGVLLFTEFLRSALNTHSNYYFIGFSQLDPLPPGFGPPVELKNPYVSEHTVDGTVEYTATFWSSGGYVDYQTNDTLLDCTVVGGWGTFNTFFSYNTQYGQLFYEWHDHQHDESYELQLIGYKSEVDSFGDYSPLPIGLQLPQPVNFSIYPTPCHSYFNISLPPQILRRGAS